MMSCERNSTASFAVDSLAGSCMRDTMWTASIVRTVYLEILVGGDSSGSIGDVCTVVKICNIPVQA